jgi:hypothetical protein
LESSTGRSQRLGFTSSLSDLERAKKRKKEEEVIEMTEEYTERIQQERTSLKEFLFLESNKVSKTVIKYVLTK